MVIFSLKLIFFILTFLQKFRQIICNYICFALVIIDLKMVLKVFLGPINLFKAQIFYIHKAIKIDVIYNDKYFVFEIF